jgi:hypothetical protein
MTTRPVDIVMLGGGDTGIAITGWVRRGMSVAMIDARDFGGARSHAEKEIGASCSRLLNKAGDTDRSYMRRRTGRIGRGNHHSHVGDVRKDPNDQNM